LCDCSFHRSCSLLLYFYPCFFLLKINIVFAALGMLSPSSRGALVTAACFLYVFMGLIAGFYAGRIYKTIKGSN